MGDCLLLTSPVRALKSEFPGFSISVVVEDRFAGCFDGNPDFDEVIAARGKPATMPALLGRGYDAVINLHGGPTSLLYSCCARGLRIGFEQYQYKWLYNGLVPSPDPSKHTVESTMAALRWLGLGGATVPPLRYEIHKAEFEKIAARFADRPYAVIHPAAFMGTKRWEPSRFAAVGRRLTARKLEVVITCGPREDDLAAEVAEQIPGSALMAALPIPELAELIRRARLYIGNDTGPMHLAAAVGTPVVAVWGSSDARRWHPWEVNHRVVQNFLECNPCPGYRCLVADSPLCIESVSIEQTWNAAMELLEAAQAARPSRAVVDKGHDHG